MATNSPVGYTDGDQFAHGAHATIIVAVFALGLFPDEPMGKTELAAQTLEKGLEKYPDNVDLWVGLGNALVAHGGGGGVRGGRLSPERMRSCRVWGRFLLEWWGKTR